MKTSANYFKLAAAVFVGLGITAQANVFNPGDITAYWAFEDSGYVSAADSVGGNTATVNDDGSMTAPGSFGPGGISGQA